MKQDKSMYERSFVTMCLFHWVLYNNYCSRTKKLILMNNDRIPILLIHSFIPSASNSNDHYPLNSILSITSFFTTLIHKCQLSSIVNLSSFKILKNLTSLF